MVIKLLKLFLPLMLLTCLFLSSSQKLSVVDHAKHLNAHQIIDNQTFDDDNGDSDVDLSLIPPRLSIVFSQQNFFKTYTVFQQVFTFYNQAFIRAPPVLV